MSCPTRQLSRRMSRLSGIKGIWSGEYTKRDFLTYTYTAHFPVNGPCLYARHNAFSIVLIAIYVDDLSIAGSAKSEIDFVKSKPSERFEMKEMGVARVMLSIEIKRDRQKRKLFIRQSEYTKTILDRFGMTESKPVHTPMDRSYFESVDQKAEFVDSTTHRQAVGSLMYLMIGSRPDIAYAIGKLAQHFESPRTAHWVAVKRVFRYINGTSRYGILYDGSERLSISGFADADWAGCRATRKSTSGFIFLVAGGAVSWRSKKQTCIALSNCEAEYISACLAANESIWLSRLLADIQNSIVPPCISIGVDNNGAIDTANNFSTNQRNKHID